MMFRCPHCGHLQNSKSKLKKITCSSCQKKFLPDEKNLSVPTPINNSEPDKENSSVPEVSTEEPFTIPQEEEQEEEKGEAPKRVKLD